MVETLLGVLFNVLLASMVSLLCLISIFVCCVKMYYSIKEKKYKDSIIFSGFFALFFATLIYFLLFFI
jgi:hypothetical protein